MPITCRAQSLASRIFTFHVFPLIIPHLGFRLIGTIRLSPGAIKTFVSGGGLLHEMGRSKTVIHIIGIKVIVEGLHRRFQESGCNWVENPFQVLWAHLTTVHNSSGKNPFKLVYGIDAVIPKEIGNPT
jgi:hypothetical protein